MAQCSTPFNTTLTASTPRISAYTPHSAFADGLLHLRLQSVRVFVLQSSMRCASGLQASTSRFARHHLILMQGLIDDAYMRFIQTIELQFWLDSAAFISTSAWGGGGGGGKKPVGLVIQEIMFAPGKISPSQILAVLFALKVSVMAYLINGCQLYRRPAGIRHARAAFLPSTSTEASIILL